MKAKVLEIVRSELSRAADDLCRANIQFGGMTTKKLGEEYGQSGRSCGEILEDYQTRVDELRRCVAWVESAK